MGMLTDRGGWRPGDGEEYDLRPPDEPVYNVDEPREAAIVGWRAECFERLGFTATAAVALATRRDIDREQVKTMRLAGATPTDVVAILL